MDLLEYQAKQLFSEVGIPVLPSQTVKDSRELKGLQISYPVVLKSQVHAGGRSKAGGIRFVENTIDAIASARAIFNLPISGEYPQVLMAETRYDTEQEFFLAVVLDYELQRPVLLGSVNGGVDIEALLAKMQRVVVEEEFSPFYARRLAIKMGLKGVLVQSISEILKKMYALFVEKDLDIVEINPLGVSADGKIMALDGKITANDYALARHPDLATLGVPQKARSPQDNRGQKSPPLAPRWIEGIDGKGSIGVICNSVLLAQATWDLVVQEGEDLACCLIVGASVKRKVLPPASLSEQMEQALAEAMKIKDLNVLFVNVIGSPQTIEAITQAIARHWQAQTAASEERKSRATAASSKSRQKRSRASSNKQVAQLQWVVRLVSSDQDAKIESASLPVLWIDNLEQAVAKTISLAKSS